MSNLTTRAGKGSPLTNNELDANFTNLNSDKVEIGGDLSGTSSAPNVAKIQGRAVSADAPAIGEKLVWNGTAWEPSTDPTGEPIGHEDKSSSSISFNSGTRTFTISPVAANFVVWCKGVKYNYTSAQTVVIPDTTGLHFIYFNASGVLSTQMSYFTWEEHAPTAYVYWNSTTQQAVYFGDERHGITLDWQTHEYLHRTRGAAIASGFGASGYTTTGAGATDADAQIDIGGGTFFDEDLQVDIVSTNTPVAGTWQQDLSGPARIPVLYLNGSAWVIDAPTDFPFKVVSGVPQYNLLSGSTWSTAPVTNNEYFVTWILATHNLTYPVISVIGQAQTNNISAAESMTFEGLTLPGFPSVEFRPLYKIIYQYKTSYANTVKASTIAVYDLRSISAAGVAAALVQDHGNLSGLGDDDHAQYLHVSAVRSPSAAVTNSFLPSQASQSGKYLTTDGSNPSWGSIPSGSLTFTGDVTGTGTTGSSTTLTLSNSGAAAGTYTKVTVDAKGRVTTGASINSSDVTTALGFTPENSGNKGVANGYASLDGAGKVPSTQLPSYVDDVLEYANLAAFPGTGETGKIYIAINTAKTYRWSGSAYVEITSSPGSTDAVPEGSTNLYFTNSRARGAITATGSLSYNNQTGVLSYTQPTNVSTFTNDSGYLTGITGTQVATALGYTPPQPNGTGATGTWSISISGNAATVSGITSGQVTTALGYTPYNSTNPSGYITSASLTWANISSKPIESAVFDSSVNSSTYWTVVRPNGSAIANPYVYRITLVTTGTGTDTGEVFLLSNVDSLGWVVKTVARDASGSNRPYVFLDGGVPKVKNDHASLYNTRIMVEEFNAVSTGGLPTVFGLEGNFSHDQGTPKYRSTWNGSDNTLLHSGNYNSYALPLAGGIVTGAVSLTADAQGYASPTLYVRGDIRAQRGTGGSGVIYFGNSSGTYLYYDGANYFMPGGQLDVNGSRVLNAGNYNSYAVPLTGGTMTGTLNINASEGLKVTYPTNDGDAWYRGFGIESNRGAFYLRPTANNTQTLFIGYSAGSQGWNTVRVDTSSFLQNGHVVLNANNYNSYSPTLTGTGASGTWGISITGSSASTTGNAATATTLQTARNINGTSFNGSANITTASWGTARTLTIGATGKSVDGSGNVSWTLGEIGAVGSGNTMTINAEYSGTVAQNQTGWYTIASYGSGRAEATFHLSDQDSSRHNYVRANIVWSYGYGGIVVDTSGRHGVSTIRNIRLLYNTSDRTYGGVKVQVYCEGTGDQAWTLRVRQETTTTSGWGNFTEITPVLEGTPAGWAEGYQAYYVNEQGQISTSGSSAYFAGNLALHAGNYTSYSPSLTGSGASGTWGINITGTSGALSGGDSVFYGLLYNGVNGDLNTYNSPGLYSAEYTGSTNKPSGANNGHWIQISDAGGTDVKTQWYFNNNGASIWMRVMWGNGSWQSWRSLLHDGNYSSYALPLSGGTMTGAITFPSGTPYQVLAPGSGTFNKHVQYISGTEYTLEAAMATDSISGTKLPITFTWRGGYAATGGLQLTGGASATLGGNVVLHAGNYTSYSPSLTGSGAYGTWGINISGNAATVSSLSSSQLSPAVDYTTPSDASGYTWIKFAFANSDNFNGGQQQIEFYVTRAIFFNNSSPYGGCTAKFTAQAREWHSGQEMMVVQYGEHGVSHSYGQGYYITNARMADQAGSGYWVYLRVRAGITYRFREALHGGAGCDFSTLQAASDPGSSQPVYYGHNLISSSGTANYYYNGSAALHAGNYSSYALPLSGGTLTGDVGIGAGFNGFNSISGTERTLYIANSNAASLYLHATGGSGRKYALFSSASGALAIYDVNAVAYRLQLDTSAANFSVALQQSGNQVLHAGNYSSYALPLSGGTISGTVSINGGGSQPLNVTTSSSGPWGFGLTRSDAGISSKIFLHNGGGSWAWVYEHNPVFYNGGAYSAFLNSSNYSSYALPLSGGTLSGTIYSNAASIIIGQQGGSTRGILYNDSAGFGFLTSSGSWAAYVPLGTNNWQVNGSITASGNVTAYSDERVKANWRQLDDGFVAKLASVKSGIYDRTDIDLTQAGVSAQSLRNVLPQTVMESSDGGLSVAYGNAAMVSAVELAKELVMLKKELAELKSRLH